MRTLALLVSLAATTAIAAADPAPAAPAASAAPVASRAASRTPDAAQMHTDDCARARAQNKTCVLDIGADSVEGNVQTPNGTATEALRLGRSSNLMRIRREFVEQILKTAEDL